MKAKKNWIWVGIIFVVSLIIFIPWLQGHMSGDNYKIINMGYEKYINEFSLNDGRVFCALMIMIYSKLRIPIDVAITISLVCALLICSISVVYLKSIIESKKKSKGIIQEVIVALISFVTIYNFMQIDALYFIEAPLIEVNVLLCLISANIIVINKSKSFFKAMLIVIASAFCYQGTMFTILVFTFLISIMDSRIKAKEVCFNLFKAIAVMAIGIILETVFIKVYGNINGTSQNRINIGLNTIVNNIVHIRNTIKKLLLYNFNYFSKGTFLVVINTLSIIVFIHTIRSKKPSSFIVKYFMIILVLLIINELLPIITLSSYGGGRLNLPFGMIIGALFCYIYSNSEILDSESIIKYITIGLLALYFVMIVYNFEKIMLLQKQSTELDIKTVDEINKYISQYEEKNNIKVTKIVELISVLDRNKGYNKNVKDKNMLNGSNLKRVKDASAMINSSREEELESSLVKSKKLLNILGENEYVCYEDTLIIQVYVG